MVLVDLQSHRGHLGQDTSASPVSTQQLDTRPRVAAEQSLDSSAATRSAVIRPISSAIARIAAPHPRRRVETELGDESGGAQHAQRVVGERILRRAGRIQHAREQIGHPAERIDEVAGRRSPIDRHRVDREVAPNEVVLERLSPKVTSGLRETRS